jgi:hypothetical protein
LRHCGHHEQLRAAGGAHADAAAGGAHVDERADVGLARSHDAVEWRDQALEALLGDELVDQRLRRLDLGHIGVPGERARVDILLGDGVGVGKGLPALRGDLRELRIGLGDSQTRARLHELLIEVGGVDLGEHIARLHFAADVVLPAFQVPGTRA